MSLGNFLNQSGQTIENIDNAWQTIKKVLKDELDSQIFLAYIEPLQIFPGSGEIKVIAPSRFVCSHVESNYGERIRYLIANGASGTNPSDILPVKFSVSSNTTQKQPSSYVVVKKTPQHEQTIPISSQNETGLNPRYTFESFVVGNGNEFSQAAAWRVAESPGQNYNPLFIYSGVGLGKTHLLHAIGNAVLKKYPTSQVLYMSSETFTNELIMSLKNAKMDDFKKRIRGVNLLLIDDIQFMSSKERTQEEFFHTFNTLYSLKHQIVITSDKSPSSLSGIEERLHTRFSWGLTADIQAPDFETRVAILKKKATSDSFDIPEDVCHYIANLVSSNVRELEGALTRVHAVSTLQNKPISLQLAESSLEPLFKPRRRNVSIDDIKKTVAVHFNLRVSELISKKRTKNLSFPRHIAMYLCRKHTTASYPEIGNEFGGRDHSSVIHASNVVTQKCLSGGDVKILVEDIEKLLFS